MNYDIFISYSRVDTEKVNAVVKELENNQYKVWIDKDGIESGDAFTSVIVSAIERSNVVLFFSSQASNKSEWTAREIAVAESMHKKIIPVKLDDSPYNRAVVMHLILLDYVDFTDSSKYDSMLDRLIRSLEKELHISHDTEEQGNAHSSLSLYLKVKPNRTCYVYLDDEKVGLAKANKLTKFPLSKGEYTFMCVAEDGNEKVELDDVVITDCDVLRKPVFLSDASSTVDCVSVVQGNRTETAQKNISVDYSISSESYQNNEPIQQQKNKQKRNKKEHGPSCAFYDVILKGQVKNVKGWEKQINELAGLDGDDFVLDDGHIVFKYHLAKSEAEQLCISLQKIGFETEIIVSEIPSIEILDVKSNGKNKIIVESSLSTKYPPLFYLYFPNVGSGEVYDNPCFTFYDATLQRYITEINQDDIPNLPKKCTEFEFETTLMFAEKPFDTETVVTQKKIKIIINREYNVFSSNKLEIVDYKVL